jgi:hypothetical protein
MSPRDIFADTVQPAGLLPQRSWLPVPAPLIPVFRQPCADGLEPSPHSAANEPVRTACLAPIDAMLVLPSRDLHATTYIWSSGPRLYMTTTMQIDRQLCPDFDEHAFAPLLDVSQR